jgi:hypothetical protein
MVALAGVLSLLAGFFGERGAGFTAKIGITIFVSFVILAIAVYQYILRYRYTAAWNSAYQTAQGTAVIYEAGLEPVANNIDIERTISAACDYWNKYQNTSDAQYLRLTAAFSGATIYVSSKPFEVPFLGKVMGTQFKQGISVVLDRDRVKTAYEFLALVRHEVSHLCLTVLGIDPGPGGANHHTIMVATGYC